MAITPIRERREPRDVETSRSASSASPVTAGVAGEGTSASAETFLALMAALLGRPAEVAVLPEAPVATTGTIPGDPPSDVPPVASRSLRDVAPALRTRVARVIDRLAREHGIQAEVVETWRPQVRQEALYAQGRTTEGPVVTWTRASAHTDGRAVDLQLAHPDAGAWRALGRIAQDEGLRTLGPMDPGHLELPMPIPEVGASPSPSKGVAIPAVVARLAEVARVADVARVAQVATVAAVAEPAGVAGSGPAVVPPSAAPRDHGAPSGGDGCQGDGSRHAPDDRASGVESPAVSPALSPAEAHGVVHGVGHDMPTSGHSSGALARADGAEAASGVDVAARVEAIARARDLLGTRALSSLVMDVPDGNGGLDRVAVALRGARLDTTLRIEDPAAVVRLSERAQFLARALEMRGFQVGALDVRGRIAGGLDPAGALQAAALGDPEAARTVATLLQDLGSGTGASPRDRAPSHGTDHEPPARRDDPERQGGESRRQPRRQGAGARS